MGNIEATDRLGWKRAKFSIHVEMLHVLNKKVNLIKTSYKENGN